MALLDAGDDPLLGDGGGGFRYTYLRERHQDAPTAVHDAHSVELENLSELGIVRVWSLFAAAIGGGRRRGDAGAPRSAPSRPGYRSSR